MQWLPAIHIPFLCRLPYHNLQLGILLTAHPHFFPIHLSGVRQRSHPVLARWGEVLPFPLTLGSDAGGMPPN